MCRGTTGDLVAEDFAALDPEIIIGMLCRYASGLAGSSGSFCGGTGAWRGRWNICDGVYSGNEELERDRVDAMRANAGGTLRQWLA